ncbi:hypothetical protein Tco_0451310 [Tanacetum coccineum]
MLPSNTIPNPREDLKVITTRSGATLAGPSVPPPLLSFSEEVERDPETITDPVPTDSTIRVPPLVVQPSLIFGSSELPPAPSTSFVIPERNNINLKFHIVLRIKNNAKTGITGLDSIKFNYYSKLRRNPHEATSTPLKRARDYESDGE